MNIGLSGGLNTYGYVGGNPLKYVDRLGLKKCKDCIAGCFLTYNRRVDNLYDDVLSDRYSEGCNYTDAPITCEVSDYLLMRLQLNRFKQERNICIKGCKPESECDSCGTIT